MILCAHATAYSPKLWREPDVRSCAHIRASIPPPVTLPPHHAVTPPTSPSTSQLPTAHQRTSPPPPSPPCSSSPPPLNHHLYPLANASRRVRTLTGKEIELDIEPDYKVRLPRPTLPPHGQADARYYNRSRRLRSASKRRRASRLSSRG